MTGQPGTIDEVAAQVTPRGKIKETGRNRGRSGSVD